MTPAAPLFNAKSGLVVMAGAAGLPLFHVSHGKALGGNTGGYDCIMAITALKQAPVADMAELDDSGCLESEGDIRRGSGVALIAACCDAKGGLAVMACAAGFALLHLLHGIADAAGAADEN